MINYETLGSWWVYNGIIMINMIDHLLTDAGFRNHPQYWSVMMDDLTITYVPHWSYCATVKRSIRLTHEFGDGHLSHQSSFNPKKTSWCLGSHDAMYDGKKKRNKNHVLIMAHRVYLASEYEDAWGYFIEKWWLMADWLIPSGKLT